MSLTAHNLGAISPRDLQNGALLARLALAATLTAGFTAVARILRGVSRSGAIAGAVVSFLLYVSAGPGAFVALISVFLLALCTTRFGYSRKRALGTAERNDGRSAAQVVANLGIATLAAIAFAGLRSAVMLVTCCAALAEAAADTVSSELGQAMSNGARLITTWESVPAGTDGGISLAGTFAGIVAAFIVVGLSASLGLISGHGTMIAGISGAGGMLFDSVLGGSLQRRNLLNNDQVNFLSTVAAAVFALVIATLTS